MNRDFSLDGKSKYEIETTVTSWGGTGVIASGKIPRGHFIIEYIGEIITKEESQERLTEDNRLGITNFYQIVLDKNRMIDSGREGNIARFMNHSCNPNCETMTWSVNGEKRIGIYSLKDIELGEELTFNYQLMQTGVAKTKCLCNESNCAGFIGDKIKSVRRPEENERPATPLEKRKKKAAKIRLKKSRNNEK